MGWRQITKRQCHSTRHDDNVVTNSRVTLLVIVNNGADMQVSALDNAWAKGACQSMAHNVHNTLVQFAHSRLYI
eukprot:6491466-Amphidinium_carterae.2